MSSYLKHLKLSKQNPSNRWIVKYGLDGFIRECKLVYDPKEYKHLKGAKPLLTRKKLIKLLENDKTQRAAK